MRYRLKDHSMNLQQQRVGLKMPIRLEPPYLKVEVEGLHGDL